MPYINSISFGNIVIDGKEYHQVLIIKDKVIERDYKRLKKKFGSSHVIGDWEINSLLESKPEIVVIGTGMSGSMVVPELLLKKLNKQGIEVIAAFTKEAIDIYNKKVREGKNINALIHTTC